MILKVSGQRLELDCEVIAEGAIDFVTLELQCDESWCDFYKTVRFERDGELYDLPVEEGKAYYLPTVILAEGKVGVGVIGVAEGNRVATTEKAYFYVRGGVASGKTPITTPDAYAQYVTEVEEHRKRAEAAQRDSAICLERCEELSEYSKDIADGVEDRLRRCEDILRKVSGMLDAVGMAFCDINGIRETLASADSRYELSEKKRDRGERARVFVEDKREAAEEERRQREAEREAAENRRNIAEQVRSLGDVRRNERIKELEERLSVLESAESPAVITSTVEGEGEVTVEDWAEAESITLFADGGLRGADKVSFELGATAYEIPIYAPLHSVGEIADSVTVNALGEATACRRTEYVTLDGTESYAVDTELGALITPLVSKPPLYHCRETVTSFDGSIEINGDYIFIYVGNDYTDIPTFAEALKSRPIEIVYPILHPTEEKAGNLQLEELPRSIRYGGKISVTYKKDTFKVLDAMNERITKIEKEKSNGNNQEIHLPQVLGGNGGSHRTHTGAVEYARKRGHHGHGTYYRLRNTHRIHLRRDHGRRGKRGKGRGH